MISRTIPSVLAVATLVLAACGGSDSGDSSAGNPFGDGDGSDIGEQILENQGIDIDELDDLGDLGDLLEVDPNDIDIDELASNAEDALNSLSNGSGGGVITIDGAPHEFSAENCFAFPGSLTIAGPGTTPDGLPFWGSVSYTLNTRQEMAEVGFDEAMLDQFFGDADTSEDVSVEVAVGQTDMFGSAADDQPDYGTEVFMGSPMFGELEFAFEGNSITGSGDLTDDNGVVVAYGELIPFEFSASCS